jgi:hypothetical protein
MYLGKVPSKSGETGWTMRILYAMLKNLGFIQKVDEHLLKSFKHMFGL